MSEKRERGEKEGRGSKVNTCWKLTVKEVAPSEGLRTTLLKVTAAVVRVAAPT
jgi:hypothetical protein